MPCFLKWFETLSCFCESTRQERNWSIENSIVGVIQEVRASVIALMIQVHFFDTLLCCKCYKFIQIRFKTCTDIHLLTSISRLPPSPQKISANGYTKTSKAYCYYKDRSSWARFYIHRFQVQTFLIPICSFPFRGWKVTSQVQAISSSQGAGSQETTQQSRSSWTRLVDHREALSRAANARKKMPGLQ